MQSARVRKFTGLTWYLIVERKDKQTSVWFMVCLCYQETDLVRGQLWVAIVFFNVRAVMRFSLQEIIQKRTSYISPLPTLGWKSFLLQIYQQTESAKFNRNATRNKIAPHFTQETIWRGRIVCKTVFFGRRGWSAWNATSFYLQALCGFLSNVGWLSQFCCSWCTRSSPTIW